MLDTRTISFLQNYGDFLQSNSPSDNLDQSLFSISEVWIHCKNTVVSFTQSMESKIYLNMLSLCHVVNCKMAVEG